KTFFWSAYGLLLLALTIGGLEVAASFLTPSWPAYDLRPVVASSSAVRQIRTLADAPESIPYYNSWGLKDRERSIARPPGIQFRSVFVGDSFLEGVFGLTPLSELVEKNWAEHGVKGSEAVNLGISATGPSQYYHRIKSIALDLQPDTILEMFFSGNDFVPDRLSSWSIPPLVAERPEPSLLGAVAPHLDWLIVNRLRLSEFGRGNKPIPDEFDTLNAIVKRPLAERLGLLVEHYRKYYYPDISREALQEVLGRGGAAFWAHFERNDAQREFLAGWLLANVISLEIVPTNWPVPRDMAEAEHMVDPSEIDATASWLVGGDKLAAARGVKFLLAVAPMASVDPDYAAYWKPWPRFYSQNLHREASRQALLAELARRGLHPINLAEELEGVRGSYRLSDSHWSELGTEIVAKRVATKLLKTRASGPRIVAKKSPPG
ncbi:MAG TPA: hypothetical protein VJR58_01850, partial [Vineibacter sp.]|nr:hypothetical protein [Vineibacter sp.]